MRNLVTSAFKGNLSLAFPNILEIVQTLDEELLKLSSRISAFHSGLMLIPSDKKDWSNGPFCAKSALNCLEILDAFLVNPPNDSVSYEEVMSEGYNRRSSLTNGIISLLVASDIAERAGEESELQSRGRFYFSTSQVYSQKSNVASAFVELSFRILINLSNDGTFWCRRISDNPFILTYLLSTIMSTYSDYHHCHVKAEEEDNVQSRHLDLLCLALALLTNLLQGVKSLPRKLKKISSYDVVRFGVSSCLPTARSLSCARDRACFHSCRCPDPVDFSSNLASIFSSLQGFDTNVRIFLCDIFAEY